MNDTETPFALGRLPSEDERDKKFLLKRIIPPTERTRRYWNASGWWGDQGKLPMCVGYAWAHWIEDGPVVQKGTPPIVAPSTIYYSAQLVDEWPGTNYEGTSVRAGAKVLQNMGVIKEYNWAWDIDTLINAVLTVGPVVVGTEWRSNMFFPRIEDALLNIGGRMAGGHAYVVNGVNTKTRLFRIKNSWGRNWGKNGHAYISFDDMAALIDRNGEICLGIENKLTL